MSEIRMRQICLVAHDFDRIQQQVESVFGVEVCYRDPGVGKYGLHNFLSLSGQSIRLPFLQRHGTTLDQLALVSVKNHWNGARNPNAQFQRECTAEDVHAAPPIADPFTTLHCCPLGEGAAAAVVVSEDGLRRLGIDKDRAVRVLCSIANSEPLTPPGESPNVGITRDAVSKAYDETALGPGDLDVIELHEAFTIEEILYVEAMGLCAEGEGGPFTESRATWIGGG